MIIAYRNRIFIYDLTLGGPPVMTKIDGAGDVVDMTCEETFNDPPVVTKIDGAGDVVDMTCEETHKK